MSIILIVIGTIVGFLAGFKAGGNAAMSKIIEVFDRKMKELNEHSNTDES